MALTLKTTLIAGTVALVATLGAVQAAQAGGHRHHIPFAPFNAYLPSALHDESYGCDDCGYGYTNEEEDAVSTATSVARDVLGVDVGDVIDEIAE